MPTEIKLSQIAGDRSGFEKAVAEHIAHLHAFNKAVGKPRPVAHPLVETSIKRIQAKGRADAYVPDYTLIDDLPAEAATDFKPSLEEKKVALHRQVHFAEHEAKYKILPQRKVRLAAVKMQQAMQVKEEDRTSEQNEDIASYLHVQKVWQEYDLIGAKAESDIDDLTEDTVDGWQPPTFG